MGECLITRRGGETYKLPILNANYPEDVTTTVIKGDTTSATFTAVISEPGNPAVYTYQWYVNGAAVVGATSSIYVKDDLATTETYAVYCNVTNKKGTVTTRIATLEVIQIYTPDIDDIHPKDATVTMNESVTSEVVINEDGIPASYAYQWYKNGTAIEGATSSSYTFTPTTIGTTTLYCEVTNSAGTVTSRTATITAEPYYIIRNGVLQNGIMFGRQLRTSSTASLAANSGYLTLCASTNYTCGLASTDLIDCTKYSTLTLEYYGASRYFSPGVTVGLLSDPNPTSNEATLLAKFTYKANSATEGRQILKVNIENANSYFYIGLALTPYNNWQSSNTPIYNLMLE